MIAHKSDRSIPDLRLIAPFPGESFDINNDPGGHVPNPDSMHHSEGGFFTPFIGQHADIFQDLAQDRDRSLSKRNHALTQFLEGTFFERVPPSVANQAKIDTLRFHCLFQSFHR